jgi:hypothetical protein
MLDNTLSIDVDEANNASTVQHDYRKHNVYENRSVYYGPNHSQTNRELLGFYRTEATKSGNYRGVSKNSIKLTHDVEVEGVDTTTTVTAPAIAEISFSLPVGTTAAKKVLMRQTLIALLDDDTFMASVSDDLEI